MQLAGKIGSEMTTLCQGVYYNWLNT